MNMKLFTLLIMGVMLAQIAVVAADSYIPPTYAKEIELEFLDEKEIVFPDGSEYIFEFSNIDIDDNQVEISFNGPQINGQEIWFDDEGQEYRMDNGLIIRLEDAHIRENVLNSEVEFIVYPRILLTDIDVENSYVTAGREVEFGALVSNAGPFDVKDVNVHIQIPSLGLTTIKHIDIDEDDRFTEPVYLNIPSHVNVGRYEYVAFVKDNSFALDDAETGYITVQGTASSSVSIDRVNLDKTIKAGSTLDVDVQVENGGNNDATDIGVSISIPSLGIHKGFSGLRITEDDSETFDLSVSIPSHVSGVYEAIITLKQGATVIDETRVDFTVVGITTPGFPESDIWVATADDANVYDVLLLSDIGFVIQEHFHQDSLPPAMFRLFSKVDHDELDERLLILVYEGEVLQVKGDDMSNDLEDFSDEISDFLEDEDITELSSISSDDVTDNDFKDLFSTDSCIDHDGGRNAYVASESQAGNLGAVDYCFFTSNSNGILNEAVCENGKATHVQVSCPTNAPYCNQGACSSSPGVCKDTDGGILPEVKGTITEPRFENGPEYTDYCTILSSKRPVSSCSGPDCGVREFYCQDPYVTTTLRDIPCPQGCSNGACTGDSSNSLTIEGRLIDQLTKQPISGAEMFSAYEYSPSVVKTDRNGNFEFEISAPFIITEGPYQGQDDNNGGWSFSKNAYRFTQIVATSHDDGSYDIGKELFDGSTKSNFVSKDKEKFNIGEVYMYPFADIRIESDRAASFDVMYREKSTGNYNGPGQGGITQNHYLRNAVPLNYDVFIEFTDANGREFRSSTYRVPTSAAVVKLEYKNGQSAWSVETHRAIIEPPETEENPLLGDKEADITIVGYMGFKDPFSERAYPVIEELVFEEYPGEVNFVWRNFPLSFQDTNNEMAILGECIFQRGGSDDFFDFVESVFAITDTPTYSEAARVATTKSNDCSLAAAAVEHEILVGEKLGVSGTPTFFINGVELVGAQPKREFEAIIDSLLEKDSDTCRDTDNGNFFVAGGSFLGARAAYDTCIGNTLREYSCNNNEISVQEHICTFGCTAQRSNGAMGACDQAPTDVPLPPVIPPPPTDVPDLPSEIDESCEGCSVNGGTCLAIGTRLIEDNTPMYCDLNNRMSAQLVLGAACQNSFECQSNTCSSGQCIDLTQELRETRSLLRAVLDFFGRIF